MPTLVNYINWFLDGISGVWFSIVAIGLMKTGIKLDPSFTTLENINSWIAIVGSTILTIYLGGRTLFLLAKVQNFFLDSKLNRKIKKKELERMIEENKIKKDDNKNIKG